MRYGRIGCAALALAVLAVLAGCRGQQTSAHGPSASASPTAAPDAIRGFDLDSAAWHHPMLNPLLRARTEHGDPTVTLHGGKATATLDDGARATCRRTGDPVYGDVGSGVQVVAAGLTCTGGVNDYTAYYVWHWDAARRTAVQDDQPLVTGAHCGNEVRSVRYVRHAFRLTVGLGQPDSSCADSDTGRTAYTYSVAYRHGYLMRVAPERGAVRECALNDGDMHQLHGVTLHADRDDRSPVVYRPKGVATLWTVGDRDYYESTDDLTGKPVRWQFVRANLAHGYICGYREVPA